MNRIIINNKTDLSDQDAITMIYYVIQKGRISNNDKQYAYLGVLNKKGKEYHISSALRNKSDSFTICEAKPS